MILKFTIKPDKPIGMPRRAYNRGKKHMFRFLLRYWHRMMLPKHFTKAGAREYHYKPRKGEVGAGGGSGFFTSYTFYKQKWFGHTNPLMYTGLSRALALSGRRVTVSATGGRVRFPTGNILQGKDRAVRRRELTVVSPRERTHLMKIGTPVLEKAMQREMG
jgi:hypothetical protein